MKTTPRTRDLIARYTLRGRHGNARTTYTADVRRLANDEVSISLATASGTPYALSSLQLKGRFAAFFSGDWESDLFAIEAVFETGLFPVESQEVAPAILAEIEKASS